MQIIFYCYHFFLLPRKTLAGVVLACLSFSPLQATELVNFQSAKVKHLVANDPTNKPHTNINAEPIVTLEEDALQNSGIKTLILTAAEYNPEIISYGMVTNIQPLLEIRSRYFAAKANYIRAKAEFSQAEKNITRLRNLHQNEAISTRKLQNQQASWQSLKANLEATEQHLQSVRNAIILNWGQQLSTWIVTTDSPQLKQLLNRKLTLLTIIFPANNKLPEQQNSIFIQRAGLRNLAQTAQLLDIAPATDLRSQGDSFFFLTQAKKLRSGMNLTAWIPLETNRQIGVLIPASSVIWHLGQAYIYIQSGNGQFTRHLLKNPLASDNGYFVAQGLSPGEKLVISGAQMLLSEEFRNQIPDEDDD